MLYNSVKELIGNTPVLKIPSPIHGLENVELYAKLEYYNPFGSVKDRIAKQILEAADSDQGLKGKTVIESSSGNTAKALSLLCSVDNIGFKAVTNRIKYDEIRKILQATGTDLEELPGYSDCVDFHDPNDAIQYTKRLAHSSPEQYFHSDQYFNKENPHAHTLGTGPELVSDLEYIDGFAGFLGTCGTTFGTGSYLKEVNPDVAILGIASHAGHSIPGGRNKGELYEVGFFDESFYKDILFGTVDEAINGMLELCQRVGVMAGPTTGLIYKKTLEYYKEHDELRVDGSKQRVAFIACDRFEPYLGFLEKHRPSLFKGGLESKAGVLALDQHLVNTCPCIESDDVVNFDGIIVDIRGPFAFGMGHVPKSINIPDSSLSELIEVGMPFPIDTQVLVVCRVGEISKRYAAYLRSNGYEAMSLNGGIQKYKKLKHPISKQIKKKKDAREQESSAASLDTINQLIA